MGDISKDIQSTFPNSKVKAMINILFTANWISSYQNAFFKPFNISAQQFNVLRILKGAGMPLKVQTIKERMIERSPNATRLMDKLHAKDLIERTPCPNDRRVVNIEITTQGLELLEDISKADHQDLLENISEDEAVQLSNLLDKIRN
ncbi:MarR family winged helix-turn-helix transcriptional regulator [Oceanihabitans sediminis]|uniref:MarR family transcriptional regulator n=1 Tax=Oceanihabitans sediminis TaxID=1812012 RepID=A0A368P5P6_9FLAO|nr:MarR family transcriptional regulator [Oceanihabitans sediminis]MDX1277910.1 MarR family transcriptional regulator [Oceanihabitans sediminis]MDX1773406.1 MarR family transcriptional regulator [Oceanihabitans sediminis]RBP32862.1 DNA-binding MarR family transcriptional regulator [Oceanihabitans sediminis]RCU57610.1 MarR family transcriptional regulator [Oceanihabitans sediminis]